MARPRSSWSRGSSSGVWRRFGFSTLVVTVVTAVALVAGPRLDADDPFLRGDLNQDGTVSIADAAAYSCLFFCAFSITPCFDAADTDDDGMLAIPDMITVLADLFTPEPPLRIAAPFPDIGPDPTLDDLDCERYTPEPIQSTDDIVRLGDAAGAPGEQVSLPVYWTAPVAISAFQLIIKYEPELFTPLDLSEGTLPIFTRGTEFHETNTRFLVVASWDFPEDNVVRVVFAPDLFFLPVLPAVEDAHVFNLVGTVAPDAPVDAVIDFEFVQHTTDRGTLVTEFAGEFGEPRRPGTAVSGSLLVSPAFVRGDSNRDGDVDISDSINILGMLFTGGGRIDCRDAGDVNNDGAIDISDSLGLLNFLFVGGAAPAAPYPGCGADPEPIPDALDCLSYPACP